MPDKDTEKTPDTPATDEPAPIVNPAIAGPEGSNFSAGPEVEDKRTKAEKERDEREAQAIFNQRSPSDRGVYR